MSSPNVVNYNRMKSSYNMKWNDMYSRIQCILCSNKKRVSRFFFRNYTAQNHVQIFVTVPV